jgi:hydrogenase expression/formation protein HypC
MCLAVPMEIVRLLPENKAIMRQGGIELKADVSLLSGPKVGDFTIVHAGFALEKVEPEEAERQIERWDTLQSGDNGISGFG